MKSVRGLVPLGFLMLAAACSGNIGGGQSTLPGGPTNAPIQQVQQPVATATPNSATNVATVGMTDPQPLPTVAGYGGTVVFPKPATSGTPTPNPKASPTPLGQIPVPPAIGITASVVEPTDAPNFVPVDHKGLFTRRKFDPLAPKALLYVTLLATADVTFDSYPRFSIDVPRDIVTKYREAMISLALFDPATKEKRYRLAVAERDTSTPAPGSIAYATPVPKPTVSATPTPTPTPLPSVSLPPGVNLPNVITPPPIRTTPAPAPTLPPERIAFMGTAAKLFLKANRPVVFALYAIATPAPSPAPSSAASASGSPTPSPAASAVPSASPTKASTQ